MGKSEDDRSYNDAYHHHFDPCSIVRSFETIVSVFAQQQKDGDRFSVMTDSIYFVAELVSWMHIHMKKLTIIMHDLPTV